MYMTDTQHINTNKNGLVVVSAKERGKLFQLKNGTLSYLEYVEEHPPTYSDNEGFFARSGNGEHYGSGSPREEDDQQNLLRYFKAIAEELSAAVKEQQPEKIYIFEPEHLKGKIEEKLDNPNKIPVQVVSYGNYVDSPLEDITAMLQDHGDESLDPADPASVAGEENAEEKRKILETDQMRHG